MLLYVSSHEPKTRTGHLTDTMETSQAIAAARPATHCAIFPVVTSSAATLVARQERSWYQFQNLLSLLSSSNLSCSGTLQSLIRRSCRLSLYLFGTSRLLLSRSLLRLLQARLLSFHLFYRRNFFTFLLMQLRGFLLIQRLLQFFNRC